MSAGLFLTGLVAVLLIAGWWTARRLGRVEARKEIAEQEVDHAVERQKIDETVLRLGNAELDDELERMRRNG
ncbi:MAG: hypothetical protein HOO00_02025 [Rhodospirillaceae bacterium]|nr:hypothetical protein [Rhodospirillaceae bacterium]MBT5373856.1 hypothetical protein [Rhodospirillaceae bacterium]MBT5752852.1 hypothetical protein [Rhodospirillaceae bacterium]